MEAEGGMNMEDADRTAGEPHDVTSTEGSSPARDALRAAARLWWVSVLRGSLALLLGLGALIFGTSRAALLNFMAVYWLLGGLLVVRWALKVRWRAGARIGLAAGLLGVGAGVALLGRSALSEVLSEETLIGLVGLTIIATGCLRLIGAFEVEVRAGHRWTLGGIVLGSVEVILGTVLIVLRDAQASTVRTTIGVWGLVAGTLLLVQGARMHRLHSAFTSAANAISSRGGQVGQPIRRPIPGPYGTDHRPEGES